MQTHLPTPAGPGAIDHGSVGVQARRRAGAKPRPSADQPLCELAGMAGYRVEPSSRPGRWLLIDPDGELVRTPSGERVWTAAAARQRLEAVAPLGCVRVAQPAL